MNRSVKIRSGGLHNKARRLPLSLLLLVALSLLVPVILAQDDDRAGAPVNLDVEVTEGGIVLSWEAPTTGADEVSGYEVEGLHVRRGTGITLTLSGSTDEETTTWTDQEARDPDLLYVYRVRALRDGEEGRWSSFVITSLDGDTAAAPEPTEVLPVAPVEPTAAPPEPEPTAAVPVAPAEPTAAPPKAEPTSVPVAPPLPEPTRPVPVAPVEPTAAPPEPEPTIAPPALRVEPTAAGPEPEATASA